MAITLHMHLETASNSGLRAKRIHSSAHQHGDSSGGAADFSIGVAEGGAHKGHEGLQGKAVALAHAKDRNQRLQQLQPALTQNDYKVVSLWISAARIFLRE